MRGGVRRLGDPDLDWNGGISVTPIVIVAPMPDNANASKSGRHWAVRDKIRKAYFARLDDLQNCGLIPAPPRVPLEKALIRSVMQLGHEMDEDNAMHRHKPLLDWLKTRGYIVDDRRSCLKWEGLPEQIVKRRQRDQSGAYTITLTLTAQECAS